MAYMSQEKKASIAAELKAVMPKDWKWSLRVRNHSTLELTIRQAPIDLLAELKKAGCDIRDGTMYFGMNPYHWGNQVTGKIKPVFEKIFAALYRGNHDRSDIQTDYFDVGWYVAVSVGEWDNPFLHVLKKDKPYKAKVLKDFAGEGKRKWT